MAPEVFDGLYSMSADVYSYGVVIYLLITLEDIRQLFEKTDGKLKSTARYELIPDIYSFDFKYLIEKMMFVFVVFLSVG